MKQKKKDPQVRKQPEQKVQKEEPVKATFDVEKKSWLGPVKGRSDTLSITRIINSREKQLQSQDADSLQHNRKKVHLMQAPNLEDDGDVGSADTADIYSAKIERPFSGSLQDTKSAKWGAQVLPGERNPVPEFEKPVKRSEESSLLSSKQQVKRLEKQLEEKDKDIELLREQLKKAHRESDQLVEQLKGYRGKHYTDMARENGQLRVAVDRMTRQIVLMDGERKKGNNSKLQQLELERELEVKHAPEWQRLSMTQRNEEQAKAMEFRSEKKDTELD